MDEGVAIDLVIVMDDDPNRFGTTTTVWLVFIVDLLIESWDDEDDGKSIGIRRWWIELDLNELQDLII